MWNDKSLILRLLVVLLSLVLMDVTEYQSNFRTYLKSPNLEFVKAAAVESLDSLNPKRIEEAQNKIKEKY